MVHNLVGYFKVIRIYEWNQRLANLADSRYVTFNECPAWFATRCVPAKGDVRLEIWNATRGTICRLLSHALEEKVKRLEKALLGAWRRS